MSDKPEKRGAAVSGAGDRLAHSRQAIIEHIARRERRHDPRETGSSPRAAADGLPRQEEPWTTPRGAGWFDRASHAAGMWWRHHPGHMAVELVTPLVEDYARRKPVQFLGMAALAGAALMFARPWKLISLTTLLVGLVKVGNLPAILMSAMSAADFERDSRYPYH